MQAMAPRSARELRQIVSRFDAVWNQPSPPYDLGEAENKFGGFQQQGRLVVNGASIPLLGQVQNAEKPRTGSTVRGFSAIIVRRRPTLPQGPPCSTIGAERLSFRVRNVTGRFPNAMTTETL